MLDDDITDLLKTLYETNHEYHNVKERVVWLGGVIYLTFSVLLVAWYLGEEIKLCGSQKCFVAGFLYLVFVFTVAFILRQTYEKVRSTMITEQQHETISSLGYLRRHEIYMPHTSAKPTSGIL